MDENEDIDGAGVRIDNTDLPDGLEDGAVGDGADDALGDGEPDATDVAEADGSEGEVSI